MGHIISAIIEVSIMFMWSEEQHTSRKDLGNSCLLPHVFEAKIKTRQADSMTHEAPTLMLLSVLHVLLLFRDVELFWSRPARGRTDITYETNDHLFRSGPGGSTT